ncbi:hypothetical protein BDV98DRAFT_553534 [Pterulicium gracile]|uniref:DAGKc domain-containing protein n=1 Tax=Pterulicium gracile TaxID=1884261 RepID=A0A5C3Q8B0_9AGAR|nr:hypothetical protein BDV98DRAFT_553534 [Pterula gracilis]
MASSSTTTSSDKKPLLILINPACGSRKATEFHDLHLLPYLKTHLPHAVVRTETTTHENHAGELIREYIQSSSSATDSLDVILLSGDGTLHEIINIISTHVDSPLVQRTTHLNIALVPCGTANAMYHTLFSKSSNEQGDAHKWMLHSVHSLLQSRTSSSNLSALRFSLTTFTSPTTPTPSAPAPAPSPISSAVVVSTSLHAAILHRSEDLRASTPGLERFKIAAMESITRWYDARVVLRGTKVQRYCSGTRAFLDVPGGGEGKVIELEGPFAYFLSTTTCDRLEEEFVVAPLQSRIPAPPYGTKEFMDVVIVRPLRDPALQAKGKEAKEQFAKRLGDVLMAAYKQGAHVDMKYEEAGEEVVEYYRCSGWEWIPASTDEYAHLVCTDGAITRIPAGGKVECGTVLGSVNDTAKEVGTGPAVEFRVYH